MFSRFERDKFFRLVEVILSANGCLWGGLGEGLEFLGTEIFSLLQIAFVGFFEGGSWLGL